MIPAPDQITADMVLVLMNDQKHKRHKLWTPSLVIERLGISRYPNFNKGQLKKSSYVLDQLWRQNKIIKKTRLDSRYTLREVAYMRQEDAPVSFYKYCPICGSDKLVENGVEKTCKKCSRLTETEIKPYP